MLQMDQIIFLKDMFWDIDIESIDLKKNKEFVIERILKYGFTEQIAWLLKNYNRQSIVEVVKKSRNIDKVTANYWAIHFQIKKEEIMCLKRSLMQDCFY
jgi:hypothetical protein